MTTQTKAQLNALYIAKCDEVESLKKANTLLEERLRRRVPLARKPHEPSPLHKAAKDFAAKFRCLSRIKNGEIQLYSRKRQCWVTVPEGEKA